MSFVGDKEEGIGFEVETATEPAERRSPTRHENKTRHLWKIHCAGGACFEPVIDEKGVCTSCWSPHGEPHHRGCGQNPERVLPEEVEEVLDADPAPEVQSGAQGATP
jgi:hypothetical protein